jgi:hypothetical protein
MISFSATLWAIHPQGRIGMPQSLIRHPLSRFQPNKVNVCPNDTIRFEMPGCVPERSAPLDRATLISANAHGRDVIYVSELAARFSMDRNSFGINRVVGLNAKKQLLHRLALSNDCYPAGPVTISVCCAGYPHMVNAQKLRQRRDVLVKECVDPSNSRVTLLLPIFGELTIWPDRRGGKL